MPAMNYWRLKLKEIKIKILYEHTVNSVKESLSKIDLDEASRILIAHNTIAFQEILGKELDSGSAVQTVLLMSMRTLADYLAACLASPA